ncbi:MAG TPA: leucine--tRNA ligase [Bacteroidota bacterium]|jgi:leucyl-tRNA synthetase
MTYPFGEIERRWQQKWEEERTFATPDDSSKRKLYILDMFPYPSGAGLHVGHPEGYTATDIYCRYKRMKGFNVMHPMGWDAFGLPAERYAMQTGIPPGTTTQQNISTFRRQIKMLGLSYDWSREINTTDPSYYKWTQWIFLKLFNAWYDPETGRARSIDELPLPPGLSETGRYEYMAARRLAYRAELPVNWCEALGTVLANEEVAEWVEKGYTVERRLMRQWVLRITAFADRLEHDLEGLDWPPGIIEMQRNWIGRSEGAEIDFPVCNSEFSLRVYTTRADTIFGASYVVLAPEHELVDRVTTPEHRSMVDEYRGSTRLKSDLERTATGKEKSGVFTGGFALNPATNAPVPIWIADYVLLSYGTGAIMAVPGHDDRDFEFAEKYKLPILKVVEGGAPTSVPYCGDGVAVNSTSERISLNGLTTADAKKRMLAWLEAGGYGRRAVKYRLRDWLFSRQRYWGEPFPLIYLEDGTVRALPESSLPVVLPELGSSVSVKDGRSPLESIESWVRTTDPATGKPARRETHTMPQWAGSCWYYLRYLDPHNDKEFVSREKERYWMPVDLYVGGAEHAVLHLLYARFWHKALHDLGYLATNEPFARLINQGTILGENGVKMSKSLNNVVNPDEVVGEYGADSLRLFEMFMGPLVDSKPWSTRGVEGVHRFLNRAYRMILDEEGKLLPSVRDAAPNPAQERLLHETVKKVTGDIEGLNFNTAISQMMIFVNEFLNADPKPRAAMETFVLLLSPFAPHLAEELWKELGHGNSLAYEAWPSFDESKIAVDSVEIIIQINGKVRSKFRAPVDSGEEALKKLVHGDANVQRHLQGRTIVKTVIVKNKLVSLVTG